MAYNLICQYFYVLYMYIYNPLHNFNKVFGKKNYIIFVLHKVLFGDKTYFQQFLFFL
jgi:hypothetical protein